MDMILVVDVPEHTAPDDAAKLLNAPGDSYFLVQVLPVAGGHRAYLRRYKTQPTTKLEAAKDNAGKVDEATALSILRANRGKSVREIVTLLGKAGITRGRQWVCDKLDATCAEDGKEQQALDFVKQECPPEWPPDEVVSYLLIGTKIKRSRAWARRTLEQMRAAVRAGQS